MQKKNKLLARKKPTKTPNHIDYLSTSITTKCVPEYQVISLDFE
jgi:hypothetical protein